MDRCTITATCAADNFVTYINIKRGTRIMFRRMALSAFSLMGTLACISSASANDTIRILSPTWAGFAPLYVAQDLGYYAKEGIKVEVTLEDDRSNVMAAMARGDIEMDMRTMGEYQGRPRTKDTPGVIIGTIDESRGGDGVMASGDIKDVSDLKGKIVAAETNQPGRLLLQLELKKRGMSVSDLTMREISTPDSVAAFADPSVSAVVAYEPFFTQMKSKLPERKPHMIVSSADYQGYIVDVMIARQADVAENPEKYRKFLKALYKAQNYFVTNKEDFIKLAAPHFNLSEDEFKGNLNSFVYHSLSDAKEELGTPEKHGKLYGVFDILMDLNLQNGTADTKLSAADSIDSSIIAGVQP